MEHVARSTRHCTIEREIGIMEKLEPKSNFTRIGTQLSNHRLKWVASKLRRSNPSSKSFIANIRYIVRKNALFALIITLSPVQKFVLEKWHTSRMQTMFQLGKIGLIDSGKVHFIKIEVATTSMHIALDSSANDRGIAIKRQLRLITMANIAVVLPKDVLHLLLDRHSRK